MKIIHIERFQFFDINPIKNSKGENAYPDCDGCIWYEVYDKDRDKWFYFMQPFAKGGQRYKTGATEEEIRNNRANIWGWDGDRNAPTLSPSFLCEDRGIRVHLLINKGKIDICSDSNVVVGEVPIIDEEAYNHS